jgi:DNA-binding HxlR family transcriptional regulator/putative sterol carrier protein
VVFPLLTKSRVLVRNNCTVFTLYLQSKYHFNLYRIVKLCTLKVVGKRTYDQYCAVARALDVVGERWTLLLVRELLTGPKRFKDLLHGLCGIGTTLLTARLKKLEGNGIVRRTTLPPPAGSKVYQLTDLGRSLEPVVMALSQWGLRLLGAPRQEDDLQPSWAMVALQSTLKPSAAGGTRETYEFRVDDEVFHVRAEGNTVETRQGPAADPDLIVGGDTETFLRIAAGQLGPAKAVDLGAIRVEGNRDALTRCLAMLGSARAIHQ